MKKWLAIIAMIIVFVAAWVGVFFFGDVFIEKNFPTRMSIVAAVVIVFGSLVWYLRPPNND